MEEDEERRRLANKKMLGRVTLSILIIVVIIHKSFAQGKLDKMLETNM